LHSHYYTTLPPSFLSGSSAEGSVSQPTFRWTFTVPAQLQDPFVSILRSWREIHRPTSDTAAILQTTLAEAATAAAAASASLAAASAAAAAVASSAVATSKKKGGKKGKGIASALELESDDTAALTAATASAAESDPHGVQAALHPVCDLLLSPEHEKVVAGIRSGIRRYSSAVQVGIVGSPGGNSSAVQVGIALQSRWV
jgi:hypothetical protein